MVSPASLLAKLVTSWRWFTGLSAFSQSRWWRLHLGLSEVHRRTQSCTKSETSVCSSLTPINALGCSSRGIQIQGGLFRRPRLFGRAKGAVGLMEAHLQMLPSLRACVATEIASLKQWLQDHKVAQSAVGGSWILILDFLVHKAMFVWIPVFTS